MQYKHLFFDMDKTVAPSRQPILPEMHQLLSELTEDVIIVSGQLVEKIEWQTSDLTAFYLGNNGNHSLNPKKNELWKNPDLTPEYKAEILAHIEQIKPLLDFVPNEDWNPIEDRGSQITFSPIGNTAPVAEKKVFDPDRRKREAYLEKVPFESVDLMVKIGGSTSLDYIHRERHKGANVQKLIDLMGWKNGECVYYGDGLYPGGNDEVVIGVIDTVPVEDHADCYQKLTTALAE